MIEDKELKELVEEAIKSIDNILLNLKEAIKHKTIKDIIEEERPHEITIYKDRFLVCDGVDTDYFLENYKSLLDCKVLKFDMTMERFIYIDI